MKQYLRPSHGDYTYDEKYSARASSGGGRSSARETIGRVAAGALCEHYLKFAYVIEIVAWVSSFGSIHNNPPTTEYPCTSHNAKFLQLLQTVTRETVDRSPVRCPDPEVAARMEHCIADFRDRQDSIGGTVMCVIQNLPTGLGKPVFEKLEATLAHGMLSIPAAKGFEIGSYLKEQKFLDPGTMTFLSSTPRLMRIPRTASRNQSSQLRRARAEVFKAESRTARLSFFVLLSSPLQQLDCFNKPSHSMEKVMDF